MDALAVSMVRRWPDRWLKGFPGCLGVSGGVRWAIDPLMIELHLGDLLWKSGGDRAYARSGYWISE